MDKPIYVGTSVLDLSKYLMYDDFYKNLKKRYGENIVLLYMDTDSFIPEITTDGVYTDIKEDEDIYDASNYDPNNPLFSNNIKKVIGKFKDELGEKMRSEFVGVRSKAYAYKYLTRGLNEFKCE